MTRAAFLFAAFLLCACQTPSQRAASARASSPVPDSLEGKPLSLSLKVHPSGHVWNLSDERGKVVLLDVWATWCEPCRDSLPLYQDLAKEYGPKGLRVVTVNVDADSSAIDAFMTDNKLTLPVVIDPSANVAEADLRVKVMPTSFLVDRQGVLRAIHEGFAEELFSKYISEVEGLLAEKAKP